MGPILRLVVVMNLLLSGGAVTAPAFSKQFGPNTVTLEVSPPQQVPGGYVNITVHMGTSFDEVREVLEVDLPDDLTVVGEVICSGACSSAGIIPGTNQVSAVFNVGGYEPRPNRFATLTFSAVISSDATPGSSAAIIAFLGTPQVSDQATVTISEPPEQSIYLDVSPDGALVEPDGMFTVLVRSYVPFTPGQVQPPVAELPKQQITVLFQPGLILDESRGCIHLEGLETRHAEPCSVSTQMTDDDETVLTIELPGHGESIGLLLHVRNVGLPTGEGVRLVVELDEPSEALGIHNPTEVLDVFAIDSLEDVDADTDSTSLNALLVSNSYGCVPQSHAGVMFGLGEWGGGPILSTAPVNSEEVSRLVDIVGTRCPRLVTFQDVAVSPLYALGVNPDPTLGICRACFLGTVPWVEKAIPIVTDEPYM